MHQGLKCCTDVANSRVKTFSSIQIIAGQNYLSGHYLQEVPNKTQNGGYVYYVNKKRCASIVKESIVYPFVPFEKANVKTKMYEYLFLSNEHL